jgi:hypothetical protein
MAVTLVTIGLIRHEAIAGLSEPIVAVLHRTGHLLYSPFPNTGVSPASSLSDLTLIYCGKADFGHFLHSFSLNRTTIRLKRAQKLPQNGLSLATIG